MKCKAGFILFLLLCVSGCWQMLSAQRVNSQYQDYIERYKELAIEQMLKWKVPASITLAQGLLESGAGKSELARKGNNHFGIKCHGWTGRRTYHDDDETGECFRAYDNVKDSYDDHSQFLARQPRYKKLFSLSIENYRGWAYGLKECGYATSKTYAQQLINIIELYNLHQYDKAKSYNRFAIGHIANTNQAGVDGELHRVYFNNRNYYVVARRGDTFKSIAKEFSLRAGAIARYNERNKREELAEGDIVYLEKKQKRAEKRYKKSYHVAQPGESMYSISQKYGIRLKSLYKKNHLSPETYRLKVGDRLRVY